MEKLMISTFISKYMKRIMRFNESEQVAFANKEMHNIVGVE
jgi:hypothetical protein